MSLACVVCGGAGFLQVDGGKIPCSRCVIPTSQPFAGPPPPMPTGPITNTHKAWRDITRVDRNALIFAASTIRAHTDLLAASFVDQHENEYNSGEHIRRYSCELVKDLLEAIRHVTEDEFRSGETRGGS